MKVVAAINFTIFCLSAFSQDKQKKIPTEKEICNYCQAGRYIDSLNNKNPTTYVLRRKNKKEVITTNFNVGLIMPDAMESLETIKGNDTRAKKYLKSGKNGIVVITMKDNVTFCKLSGMVKTFDIPDRNKNLKLCIDYKLVEHPESILVDSTPNPFYKVGIVKSIYCKRGSAVKMPENIINISTVESIVPKPVKPGTVNLRIH